MAQIECPVCCNQVNCRAKKCPFCQEVLISFSTWQLICKNFNHWKQDPFFWMLVAMPFALYLTPLILLPGLLSNWLHLEVIGLEFLILIAFLRPFNIQMGIPIAFLSFLIGLGSLYLTRESVVEEKRNFELRNRPYLQILNDNQNSNEDFKFKIKMMDTFRKIASGVEPAFEFSWPFVDHGPLPATINNILIQGHKEKNEVHSKNAVFIGAHRKDRLNQWIKQDVFPSIGEMVSNIYLHKTSFYFNIGDVQKLFGLELEEKEILKDAVPLPNTRDLFRSPYLATKVNDRISDFNIIVQLEYHTLGEAEKGRTPYFYWVLYEYKNGVFNHVDSGTQEKIKRT